MTLVLSMLPPFDLWRSGARAADVAAASYADADGLAVLRQRRLGALLAVAAMHSPLYRDLLQGADPSKVRLQDIPVAHKAALMGRFDDWVTDRELHLDALRRFTADPARIAEPFLGRYAVWESSGSSGEPGVFVQDAAALAVYDALEALRRLALRPPKRAWDAWAGGDRIAFVGATSGHFASNVSIERLRRLNPTLARTVHSVSFMQPVADLTAELRALAPNVIATYPSAAVQLAEEHAAGRLGLALREVWTGGESLSPAMRQFVQQVFGCPVVNSYGASEFLSIAFECQAGCLHVNSDWVILESVDAHGREVAPGRPGATTLITNLANHVQPLIRYDLGDLVTLSPSPCACGSHLPVIDVQGRDDDTLRLTGTGGRTVSVLPLALSTVLEDDAGLFDFQLVQRGPSELLLRTGLRGEAARSGLRRARTALAAFLAQQGAGATHIRCSSGHPGQRGHSGKVQRVVGLG